MREGEGEGPESTSREVFELDHHCLFPGSAGQCSFIALGQSRRGLDTKKSMDCLSKQKRDWWDMVFWLGGVRRKRGWVRWLDSSHIGGFNGFVHIVFFSPKSWEEICHPIFTGKRVCCSSVGFNCKGL